MKRTLGLVVLGVVVSGLLRAQSAPDAAALTQLLDDFLAGASRNDVKMHERFWADDLIYTRSAGIRVGKAEILENARSGPAIQTGVPTKYSAEDVRIHQYGDTAVVAFRLIGVTGSSDEATTMRFLNTGTFIKRKGEWRAAGWQSTRVPRLDEESRKQVARAQAALERSFDSTFVWTRGDGKRISKEQLERESDQHLPCGVADSAGVDIAVYGDTGVVRAQSQGISCTTTFVNKDGDWLAVAMQSSGQ